VALQLDVPTIDREKCFVVLESGDGVVPELNDMAATEDRSQE
jgi:hypothetical protein